MAGISTRIDALLATDSVPLDEPRFELSNALFAVGQLAASGAAGLFDRTTVSSTAEQQLAAAVYDLMRAAVSIRLDLDTAIAAEITRRNAGRARLQQHHERVGDAFHSARTGG